jgi:hypothetical protein
VNCRPLKPSPRSICPAAPYPTGVHIPGIPPPAKFATEPSIADRSDPARIGRRRPSFGGIRQRLRSQWRSTALRHQRILEIGCQRAHAGVRRAGGKAGRIYAGAGERPSLRGGSALWQGLHHRAEGHCQSKFYTACSRTMAGWSSTVFARELPPRSAGFNAENRLYSFALTMPSRWLSCEPLTEFASRKLRWRTSSGPDSRAQLTELSGCRVSRRFLATRLRAHKPSAIVGA